MLKLLLYLILTPTSDVPMISALPVDYKGERLEQWSKHPIGRGDIIWCYGVVLGTEYLLKINDPLMDPDWANRREREGTRLFIADMILAGKSIKDIQYILGRMQGRQYLYQTRPDNPTCGNVWLDEWYEEQKELERIRKIQEKKLPEIIPLPKKK